MSRRFDIIGSLDATGSGFAHGAVTVAITATKIPTTNMGNRKAIIIRNCSDSAKLYIGGADVTTANGFWLHPNETLPFDLSSGAQIYGICEAGTIEIRYLEIDNG